MPLLNRLIVETARWLFLVALVAAPWVYGATPPWAIIDLELLLGLILALWIAGQILRGMKFSIHPLLGACVAVLLAGGWWMAFNPHLKDMGGFTFKPIHPPFPWAPGTVDQATSIQAMARVTCMLGSICFVCDLSTRREWRRRLWRTMAGTGVSLVLFGLVQSAFAQPILIWSEKEKAVPYFATYYYHGNAGSFINLVLPFVAGLAALTLRKPDEHAARAIWFPGFFICVAGAFVNLSRAAMVISVILCALLLGWQFIGKSRNELLPPRRLRFAYAAVLIAVVACLVAFSGWERPMEKWRLMQEQLNSSNKRWVSTKICLRMLPDAGWHGFGPGTFGLVFPHYSGSLAILIPGIWKYAHDDYLQSLVEWGWLGSFFWGVILLGAMVQLFENWRKRRDLSTSDRVLAFVTVLALMGVSAHALVDFPFQIASLQLYAGVCLGLGWGCAHWEGKLVHRAQ
jgi:hypothetical protein